MSNVDVFLVERDKWLRWILAKSERELLIARDLEDQTIAEIFEHDIAWCKEQLGDQ